MFSIDGFDQKFEKSKLDSLEETTRKLTSMVDLLNAQLAQLRNSTLTEINQLKIENGELRNRLVEIEKGLDTQVGTLNVTTV